MDISKLMVYAEQIEESKIKEIRQEGKRPISDEQGKPKTNKRFHHQEYLIGNKDRAPKQYSQGGGHTFLRSRCVTCGKKHLGK